MALPGLVAAKNLADVADKERAWDSLGQEFTATFDTLPLALAPGTPLEGGYFAGYISHTADGNPTHALIVAPRATGATGTGYTLTTNLEVKTENTATTGTTSLFDGFANTAAMVADNINNYPAAKFCKDLAIDGFTDWYLPALAELEIAYFNLKPSTDPSATSQILINNYAVPLRLSGYTSNYPTQTYVNSFATTEAFSFASNAEHFSSTEISSTQSRIIRFSKGLITGRNKTDQRLVRAFRRIAL
jgi:hypothetical protein